MIRALSIRGEQTAATVCDLERWSQPMAEWLLSAYLVTISETWSRNLLASHQSTATATNRGAQDASQPKRDFDLQTLDKHQVSDSNRNEVTRTDLGCRYHIQSQKSVEALSSSSRVLSPTSFPKFVYYHVFGDISKAFSHKARSSTDRSSLWSNSQTAYHWV